MNIHDRQAAARSRWWHRNWSCWYTLCSDLNSQPKWPGDLCANFGLPRPLCS